MRIAPFLIIILLMVPLIGDPIRVNTYCSYIPYKDPNRVKVAETLTDYEGRAVSMDYWKGYTKSKIDTTFSLPEPTFKVHFMEDDWMVLTQEYSSNEVLYLSGYYGSAKEGHFRYTGFDPYLLGDSFTLMFVFKLDSYIGSPRVILSIERWGDTVSGSMNSITLFVGVYEHLYLNWEYGSGINSGDKDLGVTVELNKWYILIIRNYEPGYHLNIILYDEDGNLQTYDYYYTGTPWYEPDGDQTLMIGNKIDADGRNNLDTVLGVWDLLFVWDYWVQDSQIDIIPDILLFYRYGNAYFRKEVIDFYNEGENFFQERYKDALWNTIPLYIYVYINMSDYGHYGYDVDRAHALIDMELSQMHIRWLHSVYGWIGPYDEYYYERYGWTGSIPYFIFVHEPLTVNGYALNKSYPVMFKITLNGTHINITNYYGIQYIIAGGSNDYELLCFPEDSIVIISRVNLGELKDVFQIVSSSSNTIYYDPLNTPIVPQDGQVLTRDLHFYNRLDEYTILNISNHKRTIQILVAPHVAFTLSLPIAEYIINNQSLYLDTDYTIYLEKKAYRLYISFFNQWTGLGVDYDTFITYVNGHRAYYPEIGLTQPLANILVYDFFGRLLYNNTIIFNDTEFYVGIGIYITTLSISNIANYTVRVNITFSEKTMSLELGPQISWIVELVSDKYNITLEKKLDNGTYILLNQNATEVDLSQVATATLTIRSDIAEVVTPIENYTIYNNIYQSLKEKEEIEMLKWALYGSLSGLASAIVFYLYWWIIQRKKKKIYVVKVSPF